MNKTWECQINCNYSPQKKTWKSWVEDQEEPYLARKTMKKVIEIIHSLQIAIALWINFIGYDITIAQSLRLEINCLVICSFFKKILKAVLEKNTVKLH